jgi:hypothetical protein
MIALNKTIRLFLDSIGRKDEYEFYLDKFKSDRSACFALLCPDLGSIEAGAEVLAFDLHFLLRLELVPAILLSGPDTELMKQGLAVEPIFSFFTLGEGDIGGFIESCRVAEKVPVLTASHLTRKEALMLLVPEIANRIHFIRAAGGLKNSDGELLPYIYTHRENQPLEEADPQFLSLGKTLMEERPGVHISITSSINLLQEIFTVKGAGTLFRKGSSILQYDDTEAIDRKRLIQLLESSFGNSLSSDTFMETGSYAYLEKEYPGSVLFEEHDDGLYLSKFAVGREARGEGLALELWRDVCKNHDSLFWRSNVSNRFNSWYSKQADGYHISGKWQTFWRGISAERISECIAFCCERGEDFS